MTEYERVRKKAIQELVGMTDLIPKHAGWCVEVILSLDGIEIRADDQSFPEFLTLSNISREELVDATRNSMLKSDSKGRVWRKVIPKKEEKDARS